VTGRRIAALGVCVWLGACVHSNATMPSHAPRPTGDRSVVLHRPVDKVGSTYHEVALSKSNGGYTFTNEHAVPESTHKKLAHLGANDVFIGSDRKPDNKAKITHKNLGTNADRKGRSPAIVVYPAAPAQKPAPTLETAQ
jgi:hypothetical protein